MLIGLVLNSYYLNINTSAIAINLNQVYVFIKTYFERAKYKQNSFFKFNKLTIKFVINKNKRKSIQKYCKNPINKLEYNNITRAL